MPSFAGSGIRIESASMTGRNTAFVPFRSGSTRLEKNLLPLADVPLAAWSVMAAVKCEGIDRIILSTDDDDYFETVMKAVELHGPVSKEVVFDRRSDKDAGAKVKIFDYIKHGLSKSLVGDDDTLVQLLPTSPFRRVEGISRALNAHAETGFGRFAAAEYDFRISFAFSIAGDDFKSYFEDSPMITGHTQSQDHAVLFHPCGVFNVFRMGEARHRMATIYHGCKPQIVGREEALDIDTPEDVEFLSAIAPAFKKRLFS